MLESPSFLVIDSVNGGCVKLKNNHVRIGVDSRNLQEAACFSFKSLIKSESKISMSASNTEQ
jgi:hypothetical protein